MAIQDDGDELTIFLANRTHFHIDCSDDEVSNEQKANEISAKTLDFLQKLFDDKIEFYGTGPSGGHRKRQSTPRGLLSKLLLGRKSYVWSGPLTQSGDV